MKYSADLSMVRGINQRAVLNSIFAHETTSKAALASELCLSKPAVADNLAGFISMGIVEEAGMGEVSHGGGRRPTLLRFNKNHKYIIAIDLNYRDPVFVLGNLKSEIISEFTIKISEHSTTQTYIKVLENAINILMNSRSLSPRDLVCIAISSPGVFDAQGNLCSANPFYSGEKWYNVDFKSILSGSLGIDVIVKNDVKSAALGEWAAGSGQNARSMLYFCCGAGIGVGIILNSELYEGINYAAGEIYNNIDPQKVRERKTMETEVCISHIVKRARDDIAKGVKTCLTQSVTFEGLVNAFKKGDAYTAELVKQVCLELACSIVNMVNLLNIEKVIIGGEYIAFGEDMLCEIKKLTAKSCTYIPEVRLSSLGKYSGIHGLFYCARENYFNSICSKESGRENASPTL